MRRIADSLVELSETRYITPAWNAFNYDLAEEKDKSLMWLETAYEERVITFGLMLKVAPIFDSLRSDPRFQDIVRRMNFPE